MAAVLRLVAQVASPRAFPVTHWPVAFFSHATTPPRSYVGVDINARCYRSHNPAAGRYIEIGSQLNTTFLKEVCAKHGRFDLIIDDGGHTAEMVTVGLNALFADRACLHVGGTYTIEDLHTMTMCGEGFCKHPSEIYDIIGRGFYGMHAHWMKASASNFAGKKDMATWSKAARSISLYDSIAFIKKGTPLHKLTRMKGGYDKIPYRRCRGCRGGG